MEATALGRSKRSAGRRWSASLSSPGGRDRAKTEINPTQSKLPMHLSPRCGARTRSGNQCRSPAMPNGRCGMHHVNRRPFIRPGLGLCVRSFRLPPGIGRGECEKDATTTHGVAKRFVRRFELHGGSITNPYQLKSISDLKGINACL
jgi:hypothetical protein